ncbi:MAG: hypothetical protein GC205_07450 [Bacteroidetes bacterium]|nr:hypothetical protein [Bacteroidota bacterium]
MSRFTTLTLDAVLLCYGRATQGQGHASHWVFGNGFHLEFDESGPTVLPRIENYFGLEGVASISDREGNLLYYSNVVRIWNSNFQPLFNSDTFPALDFPPSSSKANGSLLLPWPGDSADRYVAYLAMNDADDKLYISKIDRDLDSGLGGIVDSFRYRELWDEPIAEHLNAVRHANGRDWWIVGKRGAVSYSSEFLLALLTPQGIDTTFIRDGSYSCNFQGMISFSPDGDQFSLTHSNGNCGASPPAIALFNFDRCEGHIEFIDTIPARSCFKSPYGVTFSDDGHRIYYSVSQPNKIYQVSQLGDTLVDTLIFAMSSSASFGIAIGGIALGMDEKVYAIYALQLPDAGLDTITKYLSVINNPNVFGLACQADTFGVYLGDIFNNGATLPNFPNYDLGPLVGSPCDTLSPQDTTQTGLYHLPLEYLSWSVYPSISAGNYTVTGGPASWFIVHDLYGREVLRQWHEGATPFDLTAQPAGVYLVYLRAVDGTQTLPRKIIRQ